ncbi:MAG TPA: hypothetical protein VJU83_06975 [Burkholderiales bacterium]|nr:hypothetical protein [Burkholderiales bacterium]
MRARTSTGDVRRQLDEVKAIDKAAPHRSGSLSISGKKRRAAGGVDIQLMADPLQQDLPSQGRPLQDVKTAECIGLRSDVRQPPASRQALDNRRVVAEVVQIAPEQRQLPAIVPMKVRNFGGERSQTLLEWKIKTVRCSKDILVISAAEVMLAQEMPGFETAMCLLGRNAQCV